MVITKEEVSARYERYMAFNTKRMSIALSVMDRRTRKLFELVPLFLHFNDPKIPGYRGETVPFGIDNFSPSEFQRDWLLKLGVDPYTSAHGKHTVKALYCMGSTSSVGQGVSSDLDLWVCVESTLPADETAALKEKCSFITAYAAILGAEINLFITPEDRFISGSCGVMDTEDCGSAQSLFLLDEFYRSSIHICGRCILWYLVSPEEEADNYKEAVRSIVNSGFDDENLWFDFGSVVKSSPSEYFGSGLWLLYKGIDSPFKAVLKSLLMEAYAADYPFGELVSTIFKRNLFNQAHYALNEDAYCLMFRRVSKYLRRIHDPERLQLVRRCFFSKIAQAVRSMPECRARLQRRALLRRLSALWGWDQREVEFAEISKEHDVEIVLKTEQELFSSFVKSYRALLGFSVSHGIEYAITSDDAGVLSRKLYAAYDLYEGKILHLSRSLSGSVTQKGLTFIHTGSESLCRNGWHVYPATLDPYELLNKKEIYVSGSLTEALLWTVYNRIYGSETVVYAQNREIVGTDTSKIRRLSERLRLFFNENDFKVDQKELSRTRRIRECLVILNFEVDATEDRSFSFYAPAEGSVLSMGHDRHCAVGSISAVTINSWGEINCHHFRNGGIGIVELMTYIMRQNAKDEEDRGFLKHVNFFSCSKTFSELIRYDLEDLLRELSWCVADREASYTFEAGAETYTAKAAGSRGVSIVRHQPFGMNGLDITVLTRFGMRPEYALQVPFSVESCASAGISQYFFAPLKIKGHWDIYVADERNEVSVYRDYCGSRSDLVNEVNRFCTHQNDADQDGTVNFNLPQYFVLSPDFSSVHPFSISM